MISSCRNDSLLSNWLWILLSGVFATNGCNICTSFSFVSLTSVGDPQPYNTPTLQVPPLNSEMWLLNIKWAVNSCFLDFFLQINVIFAHNWVSFTNISRTTSWPNNTLTHQTSPKSEMLQLLTLKLAMDSCFLVFLLQIDVIVAHYWGLYH